MLLYLPLPAVFNFHQGYLSVNYSDNYYHLSQRHAEVPKLTPDHYAAIELFNQLSSSQELRLDWILQPGVCACGDAWILSNSGRMHAMLLLPGGFDAVVWAMDAAAQRSAPQPSVAA